MIILMITTMLMIIMRLLKLKRVPHADCDAAWRTQKSKRDQLSYTHRKKILNCGRNTCSAILMRGESFSLNNLEADQDRCPNGSQDRSNFSSQNHGHLYIARNPKAMLHTRRKKKEICMCTQSPTRQLVQFYTTNTYFLSTLAT